MSSIRPTIIVAATIGTAVTGFLAYAVYFDYKRRNDPEFRKSLKRESKREARFVRSQTEAHGVAQRKAIKVALDIAKEEGYPTDVEEREAYFMEQVSRGELYSQDGSHEVDAAACFYKALKVYPQPTDLMSIYDKTVPKPVLDVLAEMIAMDPTISNRRSSPSGSDRARGGVDD